MSILVLGLASSLVESNVQDTNLSTDTPQLNAISSYTISDLHGSEEVKKLETLTF